MSTEDGVVNEVLWELERNLVMSWGGFGGLGGGEGVAEGTGVLGGRL